MRSDRAFAIWITGLPASGKSTITRALVEQLSGRDIDVAVLESDVLRKLIGDHAAYSESGRDAFYRTMVWIGALLVEHGVPVIFDATANRRQYREQARRQIPRFFEVYVDCPLSVCVSRDPKGIYERAAEADANVVPGLGAVYEAPVDADVVVSGDSGSPGESAGKILEALTRKRFIGTR